MFILFTKKCTIILSVFRVHYTHIARFRNCIKGMFTISFINQFVRLKRCCRRFLPFDRRVFTAVILHLSLKSCHTRGCILNFTKVIFCVPIMLWKTTDIPTSSRYMWDIRTMLCNFECFIFIASKLLRMCRTLESQMTNMARRAREVRTLLIIYTIQGVTPMW